MTGVEDRFLNLQMKLRSAGDLGRGVRQKLRVVSVGVRQAARTGFLRITQLIRLDPFGGLQQLEMGEDGEGQSREPDHECDWTQHDVHSRSPLMSFLSLFMLTQNTQPTTLLPRPVAPHPERHARKNFCNSASVSRGAL